MKKLIVKFIYIIILISIILPSATVMAEEDAAPAGSYISAVGSSNSNNIIDIGAPDNPIRIIIGSVLNIVRIVGAAIAVGILLIIATKYIIASAGDRADIKRHALNYVIGAIIFFAASGILTIIKNFVLQRAQ